MYSKTPAGTYFLCGTVLLLAGLVSQSGLTTVAATRTHSNETIDVMGFVGASVQLPCSATGGASVRWLDYVHNMTPNPLVIFDSENNPGREIDSNHLLKDNYMVDEDYNLKIKSLIIGDAGRYRCEVREGTTTQSTMVELLVVGKPTCSGETTVVEGDNVELDCEANYLGNKYPEMQWYQMSKQLDSVDKYEIHLAKKGISIPTTADMDKMIFTCKVGLMVGGLAQQCDMELSVQYSVREVSISPKKDSYDIGESIKCTARGNPAPEFSWKPSGGTVKKGLGWSTVTVDGVLEGSKATYVCSASNNVKNMPTIISTHVTFTATGGEEPGISDIPAPYQLITLAAYFNSSEKDDVISEDCQSRYQGELSKNARTLAEDVNSKIGTDLCVDMAGAGMNISFTEAVFYAYKNHGHTRPAFYVSSPITNTIEELDNCGAEISTHIRKYENWVEPILPPLAGCPTLGLQLGGFSEQQREWKAPSN